MFDQFPTDGQLPVEIFHKVNSSCFAGKITTLALSPMECRMARSEVARGLVAAVRHRHVGRGSVDVPRAWYNACKNGSNMDKDEQNMISLKIP